MLSVRKRISADNEGKRCLPHTIDLRCMMFVSGKELSRTLHFLALSLAAKGILSTAELLLLVRSSFLLLSIVPTMLKL